MSPLQTVDWLIIAAYFAIILGLAWWIIRKRQNTTADYFLAGRHLGWFIVGASIFASNIGSEHLVGLAGSGATDGVAMAHYELHAWCLLVLGWIMVPFVVLAAMGMLALAALCFAEVAKEIRREWKDK